MRHRRNTTKLKRSTPHRKALLANLACSLIEHGRIRTTFGKAKALRPVAEKLVTQAKRNDLHSRRLAIAFLRQKDAVKKLFDEVAPNTGTRPGGYCRITKLGQRMTDAAPMAVIEWVDLPELGADDEVEEIAAEETAPKKAAETKAPAKKAAKTKLADASEALGKKVVQDDLTAIEGIGPKIAELLVEAGISTWALLGESTPEKIKEVLNEAGSSFSAHDPGTWPTQSALAADAKWAELRELQDRLDGGKEPE